MSLYAYKVYQTQKYAREGETAIAGTYLAEIGNSTGNRWYIPPQLRRIYDIGSVIFFEAARTVGNNSEAIDKRSAEITKARQQQRQLLIQRTVDLEGWGQ